MASIECKVNMIDINKLIVRLTFHLNLEKCAQKGLKKCDYSIYMVYVQSMNLNKLGKMFGSGNKDFLVEDAIFFTEKS